MPWGETKTNNKSYAKTCIFQINHSKNKIYEKKSFDAGYVLRTLTYAFLTSMLAFILPARWQVSWDILSEAAIAGSL